MSRHPKKKKKHATVRPGSSPSASFGTQDEGNGISPAEASSLLLQDSGTDLSSEEDSGFLADYEPDSDIRSEYSISDFLDSAELAVESDIREAESSEEPTPHVFEDYTEREPVLNVPPAPRFLSFVEETEEISRSPENPSTEMSIADIIAELSSSLVLPTENAPSEDSAPDHAESDYSGRHEVASVFHKPVTEPETAAGLPFEEDIPSFSSYSDDTDFDFNRDFDSLRDELRSVSDDLYGDHSLDDLFAGLDNLGEDEALNIDSRFNLGGETPSSIRFGGRDIDLSADPNYVHSEQTDYFSVPTEDSSAPDAPPEHKSFGSRTSFLSGFLGRHDKAKSQEIRASLWKQAPDPVPTQEQSIASEESVPDPYFNSDFELDQISIDDSTVPDSVAEYYISGDDFSSDSDLSEDFSNIDDIIASVKVPGSSSLSDISEDPVVSAGECGSEEEESFDFSVPSHSAAHSVTGSHAVDYFEEEPAEGYYNDTDYDYSDPDGDDFESSTEGVDYFPSTFKEYIASGFTAFLFKLRPSERGGSATMEDRAEFLGPELTPAAASRYYGSFSASLRGRFRLSVVLLLIMTYVSVGWPTTGMLRSVTGVSEFCLLFQLAIMVLCLDIVTSGIMDLVRRNPGAASLSVLACLFTSLDVLISAILGKGTLHMPLCVFSSLSLTGLQFASMLHARGMRKALRVPAISKRCYSVTGEMNVKPRQITLLKSVRPAAGFVRRSEEAAPDEELFQKAAPFLFLLSIFFGVIATVAAHSPADFFYYIGAILSASVPFTALLAFSLPFYLGSVSIFKSGAAIAGWSGLSDIGRSKNLIITDRDLFPDGSVDFESIRIFADEDSEKVITYAGTMVTASGSCLTAPFADLMLRNKCRMRNVSNFEYLAGGGFKGLIDGDVVICGNSDVLRLLNIRVPFKLTGRSTVLLAINGVLYGIFKMKYTPNSRVREALLTLIRSDRHPIFAIRDFNVTPEMLHEIFDIATDGYDFPPYVERNRISSAEPSEDSKISAVVCREGLGPLTHLADTGHSMYRAVQFNTIITAASSVIGILAMFVLLMTRTSVPIGGFVLFMIIASLPVFFISVFMKD